MLVVTLVALPIRRGCVPLPHDTQTHAHGVNECASLSQGNVLESSSEDEDDFEVPEGGVWVNADNDEVLAADASDSRSFGPVPIANLLVGWSLFSRYNACIGVV